MGNSEKTSGQYITLDASRSSAVYGASNTVQPYSCTTRFIIKAYDGVTPTPAEADISEMLTELTGKADRDLDNLSAVGEAKIQAMSPRYLVDSYYNTNGDWWRKYSDGWVEQGGIHTPAAGSNTGTITYLVPFASANHIITMGFKRDHYNKYYPSVITSQTATGFNFADAGPGEGYNGFDWQACGKGAQ
jgi:hypothetical protein